MLTVIKKLCAVYILITLWFVAIPVTIIYSLVMMMCCLQNPLEMFFHLANELDLDVAWNWKQINKAIFGRRN